MTKLNIDFNEETLMYDINLYINNEKRETICSTYHPSNAHIIIELLKEKLKIK